MQIPDSSPSQRRMFFVITGFALLVTVLKAIILGHEPIEFLAVADNDSIMRYLSVKAWFEGQSWYDMTQYRMLPPEGLDLHWSRYVDLGIAVIVWPLAQLMPLESAMSAAIVLWPTLLLLTLLLLTATVGYRVFGPAVALGAVLGILGWPPVAPNYFAVGGLDHHNLQILLATVMVFMLLLSGRPLWRGVIGGLAAALSLAVGLEMLPPIAVAGLILVGSVVLRRPEGDRALIGFSLSLALGTLALYALQIPAGEWLITRCDEVSPPFIAVTSLGAVLGLMTVALAPRLPSVAARSLVFLAASGAGIALVLPLLATCLYGPYASLPVEVQTIITDRIGEARPILKPLFEGDVSAFGFFVPTAITLILASAMWLWGRIKGTQISDFSRRLGILLIFGWLGLFAGLHQVRLTILGASAVPMLMGLVLAPFLVKDNAHPMRRLALIPLGAATIFAPALYGFVTDMNRPADHGAETAYVKVQSCRHPDLIRSLNSVAPGVILSGSNLGPPILLLTHHDVLTGPYHRSIQAMADGVLPFDGDEAQLRAALKRTGAEYLLLCRDGLYGTPASFTTVLAGGAAAAGLTPVSGPDPKLLLLRVEK
ncbi:hypothetical protein [Sulfitobacter sp. M22298]|uniref:hypothetical protein n=1 Tax=Sulfitobacter sp. M22298 TaxID=3368575 RepID=UPI0037456019